MNITYSLKDIPKVAQKVISTVDQKIILLHGTMGAGKTTLIKELVKQLGVNDVVNSPTFSLVNEYKTITNKTIYHFDFYRIEDENEAYDIGLEDYLYSNHWCFIEWGEKVENLLPLNIININIDINNDETRTLRIN